MTRPPAAAWAAQRLAVDLALFEASPPARWRLLRRHRWQALVTTGHQALAAAGIDPVFIPRRPSSSTDPVHRLEGIQP